MEVQKSGEFDARNNLHRRKRRRLRTVCLSIIAVILAVAIVILILALTVFKAKHPTTTVNSVSISDLHASFSVAQLRVVLNVSLALDLSVKNPNRVGFKYTDSSAFLYYRGQLVGEVPIPAGEISADSTKEFNLTLTLMADRLLTNSTLYSDVSTGSLPFTTVSKISGKVTVLGSIQVKVSSTTTCDLIVDVTSRSVRQQDCKYKTRL